ncbi:MAG: hypothetical protein GY756_05865 [bacterium]|nr:hypothetical protein [bacterium]
MRYTKKEQIFVLTISILCILFFMYDISYDYFRGGFYSLITIKSINVSNFSVPNLIPWLLFLGLFYITFLGILRGCKKHLSNRFYFISLVIIACYLIFCIPLMDKYIPFTYRAIFDILGLGLMISYLITMIFEKYNRESQGTTDDIQDRKSKNGIKVNVSEKELPEITEKYPFFILIIIIIGFLFYLILITLYSYNDTIFHVFRFVKIICCICFIIMLQYTFRKKRFSHTLFFLLFLTMSLPYFKYGKIMLYEWYIAIIITVFILIYLCCYYYPKDKDKFKYIK